MTRGRWWFIAFAVFSVLFPYPFLLICALGITLACLFAVFYPVYLVWLFLGVDDEEPAWYLPGGVSPYPPGSVGR